MGAMRNAVRRCNVFGGGAEKFDDWQNVCAME